MLAYKTMSLDGVNLYVLQIRSIQDLPILKVLLLWFSQCMHLIKSKKAETMVMHSERTTKANKFISRQTIYTKSVYIANLYLEFICTLIIGHTTKVYSENLLIIFGNRRTKIHAPQSASCKRIPILIASCMNSKGHQKL